MARKVQLIPTSEAVGLSRLLRLDKTESVYWALQFDDLARSSVAMSGSTERIRAWLVYPVVVGSTPERMQILPGVSARVWLVMPDGHSLFFCVSRPALSVELLDHIALGLSRVAADLGHESQHSRIEQQLKRLCGVALLIKPVNWEMNEFGCLRLDEYLSRQLFGCVSVLPAVRRRIIRLLHERMLDKLEAEICAMHQHLDVAVCQCLPQPSHKFDLAGYNRILALAPADDIYRRQAFQVLPLLGRFVADTSMLCSDARFALLASGSAELGNALLRAIDNGEPLFLTLKKLFMLPEEVFRWASRHAALINGWPFDVAIMFRVLGCMAPEQRPATPEQWLCMQNMVAAVATRELPIELAYGWVKDSSRQGWQKLLCKPPVPEFINQLNQFPDFFRVLTACVAHLAAASKPSPAEANYSVLRREIALSFHRYSLRRQLGWSLRWHRLLALHSFQPQGFQGQERWAALFDEPIILGPDHVALCLTSSEELRREGELMQHCVGSYASRCRTGYQHIVSIRCRHTGRSLSTVELTLTADARGRAGLEVAQHQAFRDGMPDVEQNRLLQALLLHFSNIDAQARLDMLLQDSRGREKASLDQPSWVSDQSLAVIEQSLAPDLNVHRLLEIVSRVEVEREIDGGADNAQPSGHVLSRIFQRFWPKLTARVATLG